MNTLSAKAHFLKLKVNSPFSSNLFKTSNSSLHPSAKLKNLFSLLLKSTLTKFNGFLILHVESYDLIRVSVNPKRLFYCHLLDHLHVLEVISHYEYYRLK